MSPACNSTYHVLDVNDFGCKVVEGSLEIDWDDPSNAEQVESVFYYGDASVKKDVAIDVHASKLVLSVGLDVDVQIVRICLAVDLNLMNQMAIW